MSQPGSSVESEVASRTVVSPPRKRECENRLELALDALPLADAGQ
jgi:hypothetical protein